MAAAARYIRHPNYLGEVLVYSGNFLAAAPAMHEWHQWLTASMGLTAILSIMRTATLGLEERQEQRYGALPEFQAYKARTACLIPVIY